MGLLSQTILVLTSYLALTLGLGLNVCEYKYFVCPVLLNSGSYHCFTLLVIVTEEGNRPAENGVDTAIKYLAQNNMGNINKKSMVTLTGEPFGTAGDSEYLVV